MRMNNKKKVDRIWRRIHKKILKKNYLNNFKKFNIFLKLQKKLRKIFNNLLSNPKLNLI
jgi:hypothetical protein